jgi:hypothetical protein
MNQGAAASADARFVMRREEGMTGGAAANSGGSKELGESKDMLRCRAQ